MKYRHEWKHEISFSDLLTLRGRLSAVMRPDPHAVGGKYAVRSLYFDDLRDTALREKLDGAARREKFRVRLYNGDPSLILLEKKTKVNGLCGKEQTRLSREEAEAVAEGRMEALFDDPDPLVRELCRSWAEKGLRPRTIVDYTREPFIFGPGNVRVTMDYRIRTGLSCTDLLDPSCPTAPVPGSPILLEVKWDEFLPSLVRDAVQLPGRHTFAFSKYAACRAYD